MKKYLWLLSLSLISTVASAQSIYKCTSPSGQSTFQEKPCNKNQGRSEQLIIIPTEGIRNDHRTYTESGSGSDAMLKEYKRQNAIDNAKYRQREQEERARRCQTYLNRMAKIQDDWADVRRKGYKQHQKDKWMNRIDASQRDVDTYCR